MYGMYYFDSGTVEVEDENCRYGSYEDKEMSKTTGTSEKGGTAVNPDYGAFATDVNPDYEDYYLYEGRDMSKITDVNPDFDAFVTDVNPDYRD